MGLFPCDAITGLWLKSLLILTCYYSMSWHWFDIGFSLPGGKDKYRILDAVFSINYYIIFFILDSKMWTK